MNNNLQRRLLDLFDAIGTAVIGLIALMDDRIRPVLEGVLEWLRSFGLRSARLARQLFERHLVATVLRPMLVASSLIIFPMMVFGYIMAVRMTGFRFDAEASLWFFGTFLALFLSALAVFWLNARTRNMVDSDIRELRVRSPLLAQQRQVYDQALAIHNQIVQQIQLAYQQTLLAHQQAVLAAVQQNQPLPAAPQEPPLPDAPDLPELRLTEQQRQTVATWLQAEVLRTFGPVGRPVRLAAYILGLWAFAGAWFIALGGVLETFHQTEMFNAHFDHRMASAFVGVGALCVLAAFGLWILGALLTGATVSYGLGAVLWGARLVARPAVTALPVWDEENIDTLLAPNLGVPLEDWAHAIRTAHEYPLAIMFLLLGLMATMPNVYYYGFLGLLALVLIGGWYALHKFGIREDIAVKRIIIGLFVLTVYQLIRWIQGTTVMADIAILYHVWHMLNVAETGALVTVGIGSALVGILAYKFLPHGRVSYSIAGVSLTIVLAMVVLCLVRTVEYSPMPGAATTTSAPTASHAEAEDPHPIRSASTAESHGG